VLGYLEENGLIEGSKEEGYKKTEKGEMWHDILKRHSDLVGVLTRELSGDRRKRLE
jgi:Mn-dependent DtxR family transcriptional regulator